MTGHRSTRRAEGTAVRWLSLGVCFALCSGSALRAQEIQLGNETAGQTAAHRQHVELVTQAVQVKAGKPDWVELRFRIDAGLHINSHAPHDELLVATTLNPDAAGVVKVVGQEYPAGIPLRLDVGAGEVLSTYQGEFHVRLQMVAPPGESALAGTLHYQACDARSCFPPRTLPVRVMVTAR